MSTPQIKFKQLVIDYLEYIKTYQNAKWVAHKKARLTEMSDQFGNLQLQQIDLPVLLAFIQNRKRKRVSINTINLDIQIIKSIFNYAIERDFLIKNPAKFLKHFPAEEKEVVAYSLDEINRIIEATTGLTRIYLSILKYTMARVNEVNNLRWSDIDRDNGIIWLGNSNSSTKPRHSIPLNDHLLQLFNDCKRLVDPDTYPFIFNFKDKRRILQTACRKAGVPYRAFHAIRRGMATALVEKNVHVKHIADLLGHHSLKHTRRYLKRSDQTLKRIMDGV